MLVIQFPFERKDMILLRNRCKPVHRLTPKFQIRGFPDVPVAQQEHQIILIDSRKWQKSVEKSLVRYILRRFAVAWRRDHQMNHFCTDN